MGAGFGFESTRQFSSRLAQSRLAFVGPSALAVGSPFFHSRISPGRILSSAFSRGVNRFFDRAAVHPSGIASKTISTASWRGTAATQSFFVAMPSTMTSVVTRTN
jgi:hypothetical protein